MASVGMQAQTHLNQWFSLQARQLDEWIDTQQCWAMDGVTCLSFAQAWRRIEAQARQLRCQPQQRYALWLENTAVFTQRFWALVLAGKTIVLPPNRVAATQRFLQAQDIVFWDEWLPEPQTTTPSLVAQYDWYALAAASSIELFTSGSSGIPKCINRSLLQCLQEVYVLSQLFAVLPGEQFLATVSHQHIYGLLFTALLPWWQGGRIWATPLLYPEDLTRLCGQAKQKIHLVSSPAFLKRWDDSTGAARFGRIFSSGGPLPSNVRSTLGRDIIEIFGSSESGGIAWREHNELPWQALADVKIKIDTEQALWIQSPHACQPDWLRTGDRASYSDNGFVLLGRLDRVIKLEEKRIHLDAVELALLAEAEIDEVHVCLLNDKIRSVLGAVCVLSQSGQQRLATLGKNLWKRQLHQRLAKSVEAVALPRRYRFLPRLPLNTQGKLTSSQLQSLFTPQWLPVLMAELREEHKLTLQLFFPTELRSFQGHFPQFAVYPGVAQLACAISYAHHFWPDLPPCIGMEQIKFKLLIRPNDELTLTLQRLPHKLCFQLSKHDELAASGRFVLTEEPSG